MQESSIKPGIRGKVFVWRRLETKGWKGKCSSGSISFCHLTLGLNWRDWHLYKAHRMQKEMGFGNTQREKDETALCLTDTTYIDRRLYLYLNIVVCLQGLIIGPLSPLSLDIWVREWEDARSWQRDKYKLHSVNHWVVNSFTQTKSILEHYND